MQHIQNTTLTSGTSRGVAVIARNDPQPMHHDGRRVQQTLQNNHPRVGVDTEVTTRCLECVQNLPVIPGVLIDRPYALHVLTHCVVLSDVDAIGDLLKYWRVVVYVKNRNVDADTVRAWPVQTAVGRVDFEAVGGLFLAVEFPV